MAGLKVVVVLAVVALCCCALGVEAEGRELMIALRHRDPPALKKLFEQVSTPGSAKYGQFLSRDDLAAMVSPSTEDVATLKKWVYRVGGTQAELLESGDLLRITVPESVASLLLDKTRRGSLPAEVKQHIEVVFEDASHKQTRSAAPQLSQKTWKVKTNAPAYRTLSTVGSPNEQKKAYGIPLNLKATNSSNLQMVWGPGTFGFSADDLTQFYKKYSVNNDVSLVQTEGNSGQPGGDNFGEGTLDTTYISSIGVGVRTLVSNTNTSSSTEEGLGFGYALLAFVTSLSTRQQLPLVLSMSLGSLSWDSCDMMCNILAKQGSHSYDDCVAYLNTQRQVCMYDSADQIERINTEFMKLGVRGVTLLAATGDGGSHFSFGPFSLFNSIGRALNKISCDYNFPTFPAESPYVLAVGGIQWSQGPQNPVAWTASGGGFSWRFACPDYQKDIVQKYLSSTQLPPKTSFNASNRAYPDVSALATGVPIVMDGMETETGGTSASAPAFAGIISLINDHRLNAQLPPLGFVNYRLYKVATEHPGEAFYDVKQGSSSCSSSGYCCSTGFAGTPGWDPVTGLGSPLWSGLIKYLGSD